MVRKVALITGAASGIGLEIAKAFAEDGTFVCIADLNEHQAKEEADLLARYGLPTMGIGCDVTDESSLSAVIRELTDQFGRLDILVNNAGMQYVSPVEVFPSDKFDLLIRIMLTGPFYAIKHAFPIMKAQRYGRIINMASVNGLVGFAGKAAYNSAKHGVIGLTKVTALEGAPYGITVNAVCPGYVDTPLVRNQLKDLAEIRGVPLDNVLEEIIYPLIPQRRLLSVNEISDYVLFLAGEGAKGVTGQAIVIDGGYTSQ